MWKHIAITMPVDGAPKAWINGGGNWPSGSSGGALIGKYQFDKGYNFTIQFGGCTSPNISNGAYVNSMPAAASIADLQVYDYVARGYMRC